MNAMTKLLSEIKFQIPKEILNLAFKDPQNYRNVVTSIDDKIMTDVIRKRLLVDINLASQETITVPLSSAILLYHDTIKTAYRIPKELTGGRTIVSALNLIAGYHLHGSSVLTNDTSANTSSVMNNATTMMNSLEDVNLRQTARIDLIGENTILIEMGMLDNLAMNLEVVVENDENLNNINPRAFKTLSTLAVLVTKAYIYNELVVQINKGQLYNGYDLGIIKDIVDNYSDAEEQYNEYYETVWKKAAFMQNNKNMDNFITSMFGSNI